MRFLWLAAPLALLPWAASAASPALPLADGVYVANGCPASKIYQDTIKIETGDFYGRGKDRFIKFDGGLACKVSGGRLKGGHITGAQPCFSYGASGQSALGRLPVTLTVLSGTTFTVQVAHRKHAPAYAAGKTWRFCR